MKFEKVPNLQEEQSGAKTAGVSSPSQIVGDLAVIWSLIVNCSVLRIMYPL